MDLLRKIKRKVRDHDILEIKYFVTVDSLLNNLLCNLTFRTLIDSYKIFLIFLLLHDYDITKVYFSITNNKSNRYQTQVFISQARN